MGNHAIVRTIGAERVVLEGVAARGQVSGLHFDLTLEQRYRNASATNIEAVYTFPVPWGAELMSLEFDINGKTLKGTVVPRAEGEARYEGAIDKGDTAVLLERSADGLYTANVGNLLPGESAVVRYRYAQLLRFEKGDVRLTVPTVIAPRYGNAEVDAGLSPHQVPGVDVLAVYPFDISISLTGALSEGRVASPSHSIALKRTAAGLEAGLAGKGCLDRDFVLSVSGLVGRAFGVVAKDGDGHVALASFCPAFPKTSEPERRNVKILVDCSGSMGGDSIGAAKRALHAILASLAPQDRFSLSRFGSTVDHRHKALQRVNDKSIGDAGRWVMDMDADMGGTELPGALASTLALDAKTRADVLLITDGEVWQADEVIVAAKASGQRIFAIGIGNASVDNLIRQLGEETGGAAEFVAPGEDVENAITRMFHRIAQEPASKVRITWPGAPEWEVLPGQAIFDGETIHAFARFAAAPSGEARLSFVLPNGSVVEAAAALGTAESTNETLPRLAAAKRLSLLGEDVQRDIAVRYRLITKHTNCVLVHERAEGEKAVGLPELAPVSQMLARGWGGVGTDRLAVRSVISANYHVAAFSDESGDLTAYIAPVGRDRYAFESPDIFETPTAKENSRSPREFLGELSRGKGWLALLVDRLPSTFSELESAGVPEDVVAVLRQVAQGGSSEADVVGAFLAALAPMAAHCGCSRQFVRKLRSRLSGSAKAAALDNAMAELLAGSTSESWILL